MLQGVQTEIREVRRFRVPEDAEDTALVVKMIVELVAQVHAVFLFACDRFL